MPIAAATTNPTKSAGLNGVPISSARKALTS
jgi:hypothetical protein